MTALIVTQPPSKCCCGDFSAIWILEVAGKLQFQGPPRSTISLQSSTNCNCVCVAILCIMSEGDLQ